MSRVVFSMGSNLGDREAALRSAIEAVAPEAVSDVYETPPWGGDDEQPAYYNIAVIADDPARTARDWLALGQRLEAESGRVRDPARPYGPRTLDVDLIAVWDADGPVRSDDPELRLPHPLAHLRAFVLVPWFAIDRDAELPGKGRVRDLLRDETVAADARALRRLHQIWSEHGDAREP
ncbi:2-amino-4-hydroxy-6-hydroxymethyldihydropteridine diphosphokinase [Glycomyces albidus]|jgi:2-amino-4-hydroxy-6-hydroxymethyldihydropteridine diphosphokinase|uniref:2-amino-4-hydroxy-6-hydroxymethyldihydropteridine diphosphokinase n=1 Tax=Glycomyces albidus TaxID=2656774 RepID=A0A6L5GCF8_9ACTN|nr:2-amino-4-hydroxy-6-hydroxymethyldihydropteridine diphosphokinase [Glycomyces albidus]MQM27266.1 2-amino-4-hydroxy-6-hydroxymethyldihydropteridine diphosphokinase [Glycomyces albidus]